MACKRLKIPFTSHAYCLTSQLLKICLPIFTVINLKSRRRKRHALAAILLNLKQKIRLIVQKYQ